MSRLMCIITQNILRAKCSRLEINPQKSLKSFTLKIWSYIRYVVHCMHNHARMVCASVTVYSATRRKKKEGVYKLYKLCLSVIKLKALSHDIRAIF